MQPIISENDSKEIFAKIEPALAAIAKTFSVSDARGEVQSWYPRFTSIVEGFNSGRLERRIRIGKELITLTETPTEAEIAAFHKACIPYIKKSFKNDFLHAKIKNDKYSLFGNVDAELIQHSKEHITRYLNVENSHTEEEVIYLSDLIDIIVADCKRKKKGTSLARDRINYLFIKSLLKYHRDLLAKLGNFPIVRDINALDSREFFVYDIRDGRTEAVRDILTDYISKEVNRNVILASQKLLSSNSGYFTLNRKISRYLNDFCGGMPYRLRRLKPAITD